MLVSHKCVYMNAVERESENFPSYSLLYYSAMISERERESVHSGIKWKFCILKTSHSIKKSGFVLHGKQNIPSPFSLKVLKHLAMSLTDRHKVIYGNSCYISLPPTPNPHTRIRRISHAVHHGCCCIFWRVCSNRSALPVSGNNDRPHVYERPARRGGLCVKCLNPRVPVVCMDRDPQQRGRLMG